MPGEFSVLPDGPPVRGFTRFVADIPLLNRFVEAWRGEGRFFSNKRRMPGNVTLQDGEVNERKGTSHLTALVMSWMFLFGMIGTGLVGPNRPAIEREFGLSHAAFGAAFSVIQIACSAGALAAASRLRRFDSIRALILSLWIQVAGFLVVCLSHSLVGLGIGWTLITLGNVMGAVVNNLSARLWPENPSRGIALLHGFNSLGKVAGPVLAAGCLVIGWRSSFLATGAVTFALLAYFLWRQGKSPASVPAAFADEAEIEGGVHRPLFWLCTLLFGLLAGGNVAFAALVPLYYATTREVSAGAGSLLLTAHLMGVAAGRFTFAGPGRRLSPNAMIGICLFTGLSVFVSVTRAPFALVSLALFGVGWMFSNPWPTFYAQSARFFPAHPHLLDFGTALGMALGSAAMVTLSSLLFESSPALAMISGPAAVWLFGLIYFLSPFSRRSSP